MDKSWMGWKGVTHTHEDLQMNMDRESGDLDSRNEGVCSCDIRDRSSFIIKAAVLSIISDFPGLGMLGGLKTKGYKACPLCLDDIDATHLTGRMSYQGHRRWLPRDHDWRFAAHRFNGKIESSDPPPPLVVHDIFNVIMSHERMFLITSLGPYLGLKVRLKMISMLERVWKSRGYVVNYGSNHPGQTQGKKK
ncbi:hypothetical protein QQ045_000918 [Rhodiola kirilowii]